MRRTPPTLRRVLVSALVTVTVAVGILTLVVGPSQDPTLKAVQLLAVIGLGAAVISGVIVLALVRLADWKTSEDDFEQIVLRAERLASHELSGYDDYESDHDPDDWTDEEEELDFSGEEDFKALVRSAVDELPLEFHRALEHVAIVVTDSTPRVRAGRGRRRVYGLYQGDSVTRDYFHDRILIFKNRLVHDFGHDPELLREQVLRTVREELSHGLGWVRQPA